MDLFTHIFYNIHVLSYYDQSSTFPAFKMYTTTGKSIVRYKVRNTVRYHPDIIWDFQISPRSSTLVISDFLYFPKWPWATQREQVWSCCSCDLYIYLRKEISFPKVRKHTVLLQCSTAYHSFKITGMMFWLQHDAWLLVLISQCLNEN